MKALRAVIIFGFIFSLGLSALAEDTLHQEILSLGCETIGVDGYCAQDTFDIEMSFSDLIEQSRMEVIYDHNRLTMTLTWNKAIENVTGLASQSFLQKVEDLRKSGKVQSIMELHPHPEYCPAEENCNYAYFFLYLKDGTSFFFHWMK